MTLKDFWHKIYLEPRRRSLIRRRGLELLKEIDLAMRTHDKPYTLTFGTLLGAIREKGFIPHDYDVDIAVWADEDYSEVFKTLESRGFVLKREIIVDNGDFGHEYTYCYKEIDVDFFFMYPMGDGSYYGTEFRDQPGCNNWDESIKEKGGLHVFRIFLPMRKELESIPFENSSFMVTKDALGFIEGYYGPNWRVPDPTFVYPRKGETPYEDRPDKLAILKEY